MKQVEHVRAWFRPNLVLSLHYARAQKRSRNYNVRFQAIQWPTVPVFNFHIYRPICSSTILISTLSLWDGQQCQIALDLCTQAHFCVGFVGISSVVWAFFIRQKRFISSFISFNQKKNPALRSCFTTPNLRTGIVITPAAPCCPSEGPCTSSILPPCGAWGFRWSHAFDEGIQGQQNETKRSKRR